jgi:hypothetical protein
MIVGWNSIGEAAWFMRIPPVGRCSVGRDVPRPILIPVIFNAYATVAEEGSAALPFGGGDGNMAGVRTD